MRRQISTAKDDTPPTMLRGISAMMSEQAYETVLEAVAERLGSSSLPHRTTGLGSVILVRVGYEPLRR